MPPLLHLLFFMSAALISSSSGADTLTPKQTLSDGDGDGDGDTLISANQSFELGFFTPPNSNSRYVGIWYYNISIQTVVWVANRDNPITGRVGSLSLTPNGTLVVTDGNKTVVWSSSSGAQALSNPVAQLLGDGNFVVRESTSSSDNSDAFAWQSFYHPTDTVLPGMKFGWNPKTGLRNLTAWKSISDPSPGPYVAAMDIRGYPEITLWAGDRLTWRSGPWNGVRFSGVPEQMNVNMFAFIFVARPDEDYYMIKMRDPSIRFRIIVNQSGTSQGLVWIDQTQFWNVFWSAPKDQCDAAAPCGPYGVCDPNEWPICSCLQGFEPKSPSNWQLRDGSDGCVRKTPLDCTNMTDGFRLVSGAKLPDASRAIVDLSLTLDACRAKCLGNCSCKAYASANISSGTGCIFWPTDPVGIRVYTNGGQDLYIRQAAADLGSDSKRIRWGIIVPILAGCVVGILILVLIGFRLKRKKQRKRRAVLENISFSGPYSYDGNHDAKDLDLPLFDLATIIEATRNFTPDNKLGEGGFGPVYKGQLKDGQEIAVKRLAKSSVQGIDEFKNEVMLIAKLQHRNLVRLLGCCVHGEEKMLIYEYMHNNSLNIFLFDKTKSDELDWKTRFNIILGVARGLVYLHQDSRFRIIHRDLKASNILLDKDMNPKISDFGMARIFGGDESEVNTRRVVGTYGYMSPEYAMGGIFSVKSDVFSFGVLILEIISGKRNRGVYVSERHENLLGLAWSLWQEGHGLDLVDKSIGDSYSLPELLRCIKVGLLCVQERPEDRPIMSTVVLMLGSDNSHLPQPKQPGFIAAKSSFETDSSSSKLTSVSGIDMSITMLEGR